jgi:hypothetical protein
MDFDAQHPGMKAPPGQEATQPDHALQKGTAPVEERKTMTKADLVEEVARVAELAKKDR